MTITYTIPGARTLDQLSEVTFDGQPDENAKDNCVATSLAEALNILDAGGATKFVGDELKDAVYGQGYVGVQSAAHYVAYCHDQGVTLAAHSASQAGLIAAIHDEVAAGHPVVVTMPSQWSSAPIDPVHPAGSTHVGLAVGIGPGEIRVMNPWHGFMQDASDDWWQARLCYGQVWTMQKVSETVAVPSSSTAGQPTGFYGLVTTSNADVWHCPSTGQDVALGYRWFYAGLRGPGGQTATQLLGLPISGEYGVDGGKVRQDYERGSIIYDKSQPSAWQFYYAAVGQELQAARAQVKQTSDALVLAKQQASLDEDIIADQKQQIDKLTAQVAQLTAQLAAAQSSQQTPPPVPAPSPSGEEIAQAAAQIFGEAFASALATALAASAPIPVSPVSAAASSGAGDVNAGG